MPVIHEVWLMAVKAVGSGATGGSPSWDWVPSFDEADGGQVTVGHRLVDDYLEMDRARARSSRLHPWARVRPGREAAG